MPKQAKNASITFQNVTKTKLHTVQCDTASIGQIIEWYAAAHSGDHINITTWYPKREICRTLNAPPTIFPKL